MEKVSNKQLKLMMETKMEVSSLSEGDNGLIGLNRDLEGKIIHDELYEAWIEHNRKQKEKRLIAKAEREAIEKARRDSLTPLAKITEDIERYLNAVGYDGEYDIEQLSEMFKQYNELK